MVTLKTVDCFQFPKSIKSINLKMLESLKIKEDESKETIQDIAIKVVEEQMKTSHLERGSKERTVLFLGSKSVGKSTVINKFFERDETAPRPTWALEYSYGRRSGQTQHVQKQVLNIWELGTLENVDDLISLPLNTHGLTNFAVVLMLDLSQPQSIWSDFEKSYKGLLQQCGNKISNDDLHKLREQSAIRLKKDPNEESSEDLLPFPMVIVGGKYDIFMNFDPDLRQHVCHLLRSLNQLLGSAVLFYSQKIPKLAKTLRDTISHVGFGSPTNPFRSHVTSPHEPLSIWFGTDNWVNINEGAADPLSMEDISENYKQNVPLKKTVAENKIQIMDPAKDPGFKEGIIDDMRAQKDEELQLLLRESLLRGQFESVAD